MKQKSWLSITSLLLLSSSLLAACGGNENNNNTTGANASPSTSASASTSTDAKKNESSGEPVTIDFWFPGESEVLEEYFVNAAKEFEASQDRIKVNVTVLPSKNTDIDTKLNAAKLSGTFPDVLSAYLIFIGTRGSLGDFANLDEYVNNWEDKADLQDSALNLGKYKGQSVGLGFFPAPEIMTYRKDYFQEAGLDPEKPPTTWEELKEYAEKLAVKDASGKIVRGGVDVPQSTASVFFEPFVRQNGSPIIDEANEVPVFADDAATEAFEYLTELSKSSLPYDYQKRDTTPFLSGQSAISYLTTPIITNLLKTNPEFKDKLGFGPVLKRKEQVAFTGYRLFTIGNTSKHKDEAWEFIKFMMSKEQMWQRYEKLQIPVVRKSLEEQFIAANPAINSVLVDYVKYGKGKPTTYFTAQYNKFIEKAYEETVTKAKPAAQALQEAQSGLEQELKSIK